MLQLLYNVYNVETSRFGYAIGRGDFMCRGDLMCRGDFMCNDKRIKYQINVSNVSNKTMPGLCNKALNFVIHMRYFCFFKGLVQITAAAASDSRGLLRGALNSGVLLVSAST